MEAVKVGVSQVVADVDVIPAVVRVAVLVTARVVGVVVVKVVKDNI